MALKSYLIGIAGPSGAGKSYLASPSGEVAQGSRFVARPLLSRSLALPLEERARSNFDEPAALEHELLIDQVADLHDGRTIAVPTYDFSVHTRASITQWFEPAAFVIIEGLFTLHWHELRRLLATSVYVEMADDICLQRRQQRDVRESGRTPESVVAQFRTTVAPMAELYVRPTRLHADVVLSGDTPIDDGVARVLDHLRRQIGDAAADLLLAHHAPALVDEEHHASASLEHRNPYRGCGSCCVAPAQQRTIDLSTSKALNEPVPGAPQRTNSLPVTVALSPDGKFLALLNNGYGSAESEYHQSIAILDLATNKLTRLSRCPSRRSRQAVVFRGTRVERCWKGAVRLHSVR